MKGAKVLFFITGSLPSESQLEQAKKINGNVCFRNAGMVGDEHNPEECDYVTGEVPGAYDHFSEWEFEIEVAQQPVKAAIKVPTIKPEQKAAMPTWTPNA